MVIRPLLLGHRGTRGEKSVSENTLASFDLALAQGCDGFEFDVRLSSDGRGVVSHDPSLHGLEIAQSDYSDLLAARKRRASRRFSYGTPELPCLEDVLAKYAERAFLDIELKTEGLETATLNLLAHLPAIQGLVVSSFLPEVLRTLATLDDGLPKRPAAAVERLPLGLIFATSGAMRQWDRLPLSHLMPRHDLLDRSLIDEFHAAGKQVFAWTVNRERRMRTLTEMGVDGLISDSPALLARFRESFEH